MPYGVDASMQAMQSPDADPSIDFFLGPTRLQQLPPPHHPVLTPRELAQPAVISARPQKPFFRTGFCGLGGHAST